MEQDFIIFTSYATSFNSSGVVIKASTTDVAEEIARKVYESDGYEMYEVEPDTEDYDELCSYFSQYNIVNGYYIGGYVPVVYKTRAECIDEVLKEL